MKYFTPNLFVRLQNLQDETALHEWEQAVEEYGAALKQSIAEFPQAVQEVTREFRLHDADVICVSRSAKTLTVTLRLVPADPRLLILCYTLVEDPQIDRAALPREHCTEQASWLYDELTLEKASPTSEVVCSQQILLSNGWEVGLRFRDFAYSRPEVLLPALAGSTD